jgi:hypothetical protein
MFVILTALAVVSWMVGAVWVLHILQHCAERDNENGPVDNWDRAVIIFMSLFWPLVLFFAYLHDLLRRK